MLQEDICCLICWAFWLPPVAVAKITGCGVHVWINIFFMLFTVFGGFIHALVLIYMADSARIVAPRVVTPVVVTPTMGSQYMTHQPIGTPIGPPVMGPALTPTPVVTGIY